MKRRPWSFIELTLTVMLGLFTAVALHGCVSAPAPAGDARARAVEGVYKSEVALNIALGVALGYANLPACPLSSPVCADPEVLAKIAAAAPIAREALLSAEGTVRDPLASQSAALAAISAGNGALATLAALTAGLPALMAPPAPEVIAPPAAAGGSVDADTLQTLSLVTLGLSGATQVAPAVFQQVLAAKAALAAARESGQPLGEADFAAVHATREALEAVLAQAALAR